MPEAPRPLQLLGLGLAVFWLATAAALGGLAFYAADRFEMRDREREQALAGSLLRGEARVMADLVRDYSWWDAAVAGLVETPDPVWADSNIGSYLHDSYGTTVATVVHPGGVGGLTFIDGELREAGPGDAIPASDLRELYRQANKGPMSQPNPVTAFLGRPDGLVAVAASALTPEYPAGDQLIPRPRSVLIIARPLGEDFLMRAADEFLLDAPRVASLTDVIGTDRMAIPIVGLDGKEAGFLTWDHGGAAGLFREELITTVVSAFVILALAAALFGLYLYRARHMTSATNAALAGERRLLDARTHHLTTIAHDLKTPLTAMQSAADLLMHFGDRMSAEERRAELALITERIQVMDQVISDAVAMQRGDGLEFDPRPTDPAEQIREHWRNRGMAGDRALQITDVRESRGDEALDRRLFGQATGNVLSNAVKYGAPGTPVRVRLSSLDGVLTVAISNEGDGIAAEQMDRVSQAFVRGSNSAGVDGLGLGLSIATRATRDHGGDLSFDSRAGEGVTVTLTFRVGNSVEESVA